MPLAKPPEQKAGRSDHKLFEVLLESDKQRAADYLAVPPRRNPEHCNEIT